MSGVKFTPKKRKRWKGRHRSQTNWSLKVWPLKPPIWLQFNKKNKTLIKIMILYFLYFENVCSQMCSGLHRNVRVRVKNIAKRNVRRGKWSEWRQAVDVTCLRSTWHPTGKCRGSVWASKADIWSVTSHVACVSHLGMQRSLETKPVICYWNTFMLIESYLWVLCYISDDWRQQIQINKNMWYD